METNTSSAASSPCAGVSTISTTSTNTTSANNCTNTGNINSSGSGASLATSVPASQQQTQQQAPLSQLLTAESIEACQKQDDINSLSLASGLSEGQHSLSGAPSASSSPILSPQGKIFGRNANGTMVATLRPNNEAEIQLYRVLQRASLLAYYDTLLEMGGDDVQQLYDAGEEEFLEIMALVGMASKPLHVRRLQKALHEWASNPTFFQNTVPQNPSSICETPIKPPIFNTDTTPTMSRHKVSTFNSIVGFQPTPLLHTASSTNLPSMSASLASSQQLISQISPAPMPVSLLQPHTPAALSNPLSTTNTLQSSTTTAQTASGANVIASSNPLHQVSSSSPQLTPVLTEVQVQRITLGAEKIAQQLPQREPRAHTSKKRATRELEQVIAMSENDPKRMDEIRKYSAIYGRFDCKRRPEKPLTLHEVCVNEAAAQLCRLVPALLTRRDELFPLARQIVKDAGFGHSASIARYGSLLTQMQSAQSTAQRSATNVPIDCESSLEHNLPPTTKRQRLSSTESSTTLIGQTREVADDAKYNLFAMYQKFAKPPFDLAEIAKFSVSKPDYDDNENDNDSRFSFSNSSTPPMPLRREDSDNDRCSNSYSAQEISVERLSSASILNTSTQFPRNKLQRNSDDDCETVDLSNSSTMSGIQVISSAGGNIIAVANPALVLNDVLPLRGSTSSTDL